VFTRNDNAAYRRLGFDHVRLRWDEVQLWDDSERPVSDGLNLMDEALDWAEEAGLRVVVDLHILRSHLFNQENRTPAVPQTRGRREVW